MLFLAVACKCLALEKELQSAAFFPWVVPRKARGRLFGSRSPLIPVSRHQVAIGEEGLRFVFLFLELFFFGCEFLKLDMFSVHEDPCQCAEVYADKDAGL